MAVRRRTAEEGEGKEGVEQCAEQFDFLGGESDTPRAFRLSILHFRSNSGSLQDLHPSLLTIINRTAPRAPLRFNSSSRINSSSSISDRISGAMAVIEEVHISEEIHQLKAEANRQFAAKDYDAALSTYLDILAKLPPREPAPSSETEVSGSDTEDEASGFPITVADSKVAPETKPENEEQIQIRLFRSVIYANIAATHLKLEQHKEAVIAANQSLLDQPNYVKALYRRAQANEHIAGWSGLSSALEDYKLLLALPDLPQSTKPEVTAAIQRLEPRAKEAAEREKDEMLSKLKGLGDSILGNFGLSTDNFKFTQQPGGGYSMNFVR